MLGEEFLKSCDENIYWTIESVSVEKKDNIIIYYIDLEISMLANLIYRESGDYPYDAGKIAIALIGDMVIYKEESLNTLEHIELEISDYEHIEPEIYNWFY